MTVTTRIFPKKPIIMTRENKIGTMIGTTAVRISRFWSISLASAVREKLDWELFIILKKRILKHTEILNSYFCFVKPKNKQMFAFSIFFFFSSWEEITEENTWDAILKDPYRLILSIWSRKYFTIFYWTFPFPERSGPHEGLLALLYTSKFPTVLWAVPEQEFVIFHQFEWQYWDRTPYFVRLMLCVTNK